MDVFDLQQAKRRYLYTFMFLAVGCKRTVFCFYFYVSTCLAPKTSLFMR